MALDKGNKLVFEILGNVDPSISGPRLGRLSIPSRKDLETPNFLALTSRGVTPHMTPDVIAAHTKFGGVHMALEDFVEKASKGTPPVMSYPGSSVLHTFTALPSRIATVLAPRRSPAVTAPVGNSNTSVSIFTSTGFQAVSNTAYISYIKTLRPDIAIALADVPYGTLPGTKRIAKMGDRTQAWLTLLISQKSEAGNQAIFAPVLPIEFNSQAEYINFVADELADEISGFAFYDSDILPDIPATTAVVRLPRLSLDEPSSPGQILRQISMGMDVFTVPFIGFATDAGIALTFSFSSPPTPSSSPPEKREDSEMMNTNEKEDGSGTTLLPLGIDMWSPTHSTSLSPFSTNCKCYTCTSHHRAYIQHLLSAKEMLGWVLLQIHNHYILSEFFKEIRESIGRGSFEEDCKVFEGVYESELPEKSGQGPRVRGYHYKSEGPGEQPKRNRAAWGNLGGGEVDGDGGGGGLVPDEEAEKLVEKGFAEKMEE